MFLKNAAFGDLDALCALEQTCLSEDPWSRDSLASCIADPMCITRMALIDGACVGYICARRIPNEAEVYRVATLPSHRRKGVGSALLASFLGSATSQGCDTFFLEVRASNTAAQGLYASFGFEVMGTRRGYYRNPREDGVMMRLLWKEDEQC